MTASNTSNQQPNWRNLAWLADAPLFIDGQQVSALYDAVIKPEYETSSIKISASKLESLQFSGKIGGEAEIGGVDWLKAIFPFLKAKVSAEAAATGKSDQTDSNEILLLPIDNPQRQLVQLALHYFANLPNRVKTVRDPSEPAWHDPVFVSELPRGFVFVDFPPLTKFIPMAAELANGKVETIYENLMRSFVGPSVQVPRYPRAAYFLGKDAELLVKRKEYWDFFNEFFSSTISMEAVEKVSLGGLLRWIDYRVPLGIDLPYMHLHIQGRALFDTGTFAYQLIKRGYKHGLRFVGTMKSEPAMNVLAIFER